MDLPIASHGGNGNRGLPGVPGTGGFSIVDVRNPRNMKVIFRQVNDSPAIGGPNDNSQYISIQDHILVSKRNRSLEMWDVRNPFAPVRLSSFTPAGILVGSSGDPNDPHGHGSFGYHGLWVHKDSRGGRYAFASVRLEGYTDQILIIVDITNPGIPSKLRGGGIPECGTTAAKCRTWNERRRQPRPNRHARAMSRHHRFRRPRLCGMARQGHHHPRHHRHQESDARRRDQLGRCFSS